MAGFQSVVNQTQALGVIGGLYSDAPLVADAATILSSDAAQNIIGRAFTLTTGAVVDPAPSNASIVQAGGTGVFFGILANSKVYASQGTAGDPLGATLALPNYTIGEFVTEGELIVALPAGANIGDLVTYNTLTGELGSVAPQVTFTGVIAVTTGVLTASAVTGEIYVGMTISGTGVPGGTVITSVGTGTGGAGTYNTNIVTAVSSTAMTGASRPQQATSFTGVIAVTTGVLTASSVTAGYIYPGMPLIGTGVPAGTIVGSQISGTTGGAGTYNTNITTAVSSTTMTSPVFAFVPTGKVSRFTVNGNTSSGGYPGLAVISLNHGAV